ncbi:Diaminopimelate epimerase-like protein [Aaosphaeria arxii CBS 175.79]|uniref:Diaminopimelate epimerase-like protein n=1 Tax=Aaosphaeria arxii CBS 175.79 TaxID=1450172 RepID=A0A6A5XH25_9PLEO|nr:Diaminopimelate epimerase-like protein [Aaosphaeria arxii CBS 175.79]KAF2012169.1 Diaminopimelate epimerase-like protein [Aaosphaeria arxii CBS 175.79]
MSSNLSEVDFVTVDVFTQTRYEGNPLAIVKIPEGTSLTQDQKQAIAREFNLSETTFLHENNGDELSWTVDIFMTNAELPFAGHPTIGTACHVLSNVAQARKLNGKFEAQFQIKAGPVGLQYDVQKQTARASIPHDFHIHKRQWKLEELLEVQPGLARAYERKEVNLKPEYPIVSVVNGMAFALVEVEDERALGLVSTSSRSLSVPGLDEGWDKTFVGSYFFTRSPGGSDGTTRLRTRMIEGTLEDPATGSAATDLSGYLAMVEGRPGETRRYAITQGVEMGRRSEIGVEVVLNDDRGVRDVYLEGSVIQVMSGRLTV